MLCKLWRTDEVQVLETIRAFHDRGLLQAATLPDGRIWCLPHNQHLQAFHVRSALCL